MFNRPAPPWLSCRYRVHLPCLGGGEDINHRRFRHRLIKVKKTSVDKFSFTDSLNFFGSNLGLWPGLGLYQIIEWVVGVGIFFILCVISMFSIKEAFAG